MTSDPFVLWLLFVLWPPQVAFGLCFCHSTLCLQEGGTQLFSLLLQPLRDTFSVRQKKLPEVLHEYHLSVCVHALHVWMHKSTYACGGWRTSFNCPFSLPLILFLRQGLSMYWNSLNRLGWLAHNLRGLSVCLCLPGVGPYTCMVWSLLAASASRGSKEWGDLRDATCVVMDSTSLLQWTNTDNLGDERVY